jgi:hypothetical protein
VTQLCELAQSVHIYESDVHVTYSHVVLMCGQLLNGRCDGQVYQVWGLEGSLIIVEDRSLISGWLRTHLAFALWSLQFYSIILISIEVSQENFVGFFIFTATRLMM